MSPALHLLFGNSIINNNSTGLGWVGLGPVESSVRDQHGRRGRRKDVAVSSSLKDDVDAQGVLRMGCNGGVGC